MTDAVQGVASRIAAHRAVRRVHDGGAWAAPAVDAALREADLDARDRAFAANLAYETLRWEGTLDWVLAQVTSRPLEQVEPAVLDCLRLGAWQLLRGRMPDRAAVGTAVDVARAEVGTRVSGFVNGVLRGLARRRDTLPWPSESTDAGLGLALGYPAWVVAAARERFGDRARAVLEAGNVSPGVTLRAVGDRDALLAELAQAGVTAEPGVHAPEGVRAPGADPGRLAAVAEGRAVVQDEASMLVVRALGEGAGLALDACAAPGGKTTHLAQLGWGVVAADVHAGRARMVADLAARTGCEVGVVAADAALPPFPAGCFDAALVDVPCTGLGTVRRRPELRWRRTAADPARLADLQLAILLATAQRVRPGGRLVYSACTWTQAETDEVVRRALAVAGDLLEVEAPMLAAGTPTRHGRQLAPDADGVDGMFVAALRRRT